MLIRLYTLLTWLAEPLVLAWASSHPKLGEGFAERSARKLPELPPGRPLIWLHGVSVGEVRALMPVARELLRLRPETTLLITTTTPTGRKVLGEEAAGLGAVEAYFPLDLPRTLGRFFTRVRPTLFVSFEAEAWPNLLLRLGRMGVPRALANARIFLRTKRGPLKRRFSRELYGLFDLIIAQNEAMAEAFSKLLGSGAKIRVSGNTKYSRLPEQVDQEFLSLVLGAMGWTDGREIPIVAVASTHPLPSGKEACEESLILAALMEAERQVGRPVRVVLAPRHPERSEELKRLLMERFNLRWACLSEILAGKVTGSGGGEEERVLLVDTIGHLARLYPLASLVVMGGSFHPRIGGHNLYEAAQFGVPLMAGPNLASVQEEATKLSQVGALVKVSDEGELERELARFLRSPDDFRQAGERGKEVVLEASRAAELTAGWLVELMEKGKG